MPTIAKPARAWNHFPCVPFLVLYGHKLHDLRQDEEAVCDNPPKTY